MQLRSVSGSLFEKELCEKLGYKKDSKSPKISWTGCGSNNLDRIKSFNFNYTNFEPCIDSTYDKWDAVTPDGSRREIKKYKKKKAHNWTLYSEPIIKVCTNKTLQKITEEYGNGNLSVGREKYNNFI